MILKMSETQLLGKALPDWLYLTQTCFIRLIVYRLGAQNLTFVAPMPEQVGTLTAHFPEVSGGTYQKFSPPKLGELGQIDVFQNRMLSQWGKSDQKLRFFNIPRTKNREKLTLNF